MLPTLATVLSVPAIPAPALANGSHLHFGTIDIPLVVFYGIGGFFVVVVVLFIASWIHYRRSQSRGDLSPGPQKSPRDDEKEEDVT
jgi:hypothetical protein